MQGIAVNCPPARHREGVLNIRSTYLDVPHMHVGISYTQHKKQNQSNRKTNDSL